MDEILKILATSGVAGAVLAYFLWKYPAALDRNTAELAKVREEIARLNLGDMLRLFGSPHVPQVLKDSAMKLIHEIERANPDLNGGSKKP